MEDNHYFSKDAEEAYRDALKTMERECTDADLDKLLSLYQQHDNSLTSLAEDGENSYHYLKESKIVQILERTIVYKVMKEHGYYLSKVTGITHWERLE